MLCLLKIKDSLGDALESNWTCSAGTDKELTALNQIPYDYTVEVRYRFKGLDMIDRVPEKLWTEVCDIVLEAVTQTKPKKKECKKKN